MLIARCALGAEAERTVVLGFGGAAELDLPGASTHGGGNVMLEYEAIDGWLEFELGVSALSVHGGLEVPIDLLVKKPFRLSDGAELMIGLGPEVVHVTGPDHGTFGGIEFVADFMFWPTHHFGWWLEPSYDLVFQNRFSNGFGCTGGLLFGW